MKFIILSIINGLLVGVISKTINYVGTHDLTTGELIVSQLIGGGAGILIIITTGALTKHN